MTVGSAVKVYNECGQNRFEVQVYSDCGQYRCQV